MSDEQGLNDPVGHVARRPLLAIAIALIVGVAFHARLPHMVPLWIVFAGLALAVNGVVRSRPAGARWR